MKKSKDNKALAKFKIEEANISKFSKKLTLENMVPELKKHINKILSFDVKFDIQWREFLKHFIPPNISQDTLKKLPLRALETNILQTQLYYLIQWCIIEINNKNHVPTQVVNLAANIIVWNHDQVAKEFISNCYSFPHYVARDIIRTLLLTIYRIKIGSEISPETVKIFNAVFKMKSFAPRMVSSGIIPYTQALEMFSPTTSTYWEKNYKE